MQIPNINGYLLGIYEESILKAFNNFNSLGVSRLDVGFKYFNISWSLS